MSSLSSSSCLFISDLNPSNCASWVQAIGSILAIVAAILVARHSAAQARQAYSHARVERLGEQVGPVIALLNAAVSEQERIWEHLARANVGGEWGLPDDLLERLKSVRAALELVPVHTMPSVDAATYLLDAKVLMKELEAVSHGLVARVNGWGDLSHEDYKGFEALGQEAEDKSAAFKQELVRLTLPVKGESTGFLDVVRRLARR